MVSVLIVRLDCLFCKLYIDLWLYIAWLVFVWVCVFVVATLLWLVDAEQLLLGCYAIVICL